MKVRLTAIVTALVLGFSSAAFGQLFISQEVVGEVYQTKAKFTFMVDPVTNTIAIEVDNTLLGQDTARGTITSFGFNTPLTDAQLGNNASNVTFTQAWVKVKPGHTNLQKWNVFEPYNLSQNGGSTTELGVGTGNTPTGGTSKNGIKFGEKAYFKFQFTDFTAEQALTTFAGEKALVVRWQEVKDDCVTGQSDYGWTGFPEEIPPTPEPSTYGLMGAAALLGVVAYRRRQQKKAIAA